ncbi:MAG: FG-GAP repeat domain-containing protein [Caulobacteraceae bacterium]
MSVRRAIAVLILISISSLLFIAVSTERDETLKLWNTTFSTYHFKEYSSLGVKSSDGFLKYRMVNARRGKQELVDVLQNGAALYAVVSSEDAISLYTYTGKQVESYSTQSDGEHIISCCVGDIDNDSKDEILVVTGTGDTFYGNKLVILAYGKGFKKLYEKSYKEFNPWKVQTADVDGDGITEISIGVYKESPFYPVMAKRPFIFNWYKGDLAPKWRGSRLSRPFEDYIFSDIDIRIGIIVPFVSHIWYDRLQA